MQHLISMGGIIHVSLSAADGELFLQRNLEIARDIERLGGRVILRVVTFAFRTGDYRREKQDEIMKGSIPVLEQPAKIIRVTKNTKRKNSLWVQIDKSRYSYQKSYITREVNRKGKRWLTAGQLYKTHTCVKTCPECENQCMVRELTGYGHVLGEENMKRKTVVMV